MEPNPVNVAVLILVVILFALVAWVRRRLQIASRAELRHVLQASREAHRLRGKFLHHR
jgi:hypothetical protein